MKRNIRVSLIGAAGSLLLFAGIAFAADTAMTGDAMHASGGMSGLMMMHPPAPMILSITSDGMGRLRGVVASVSTTSITVAAWGGAWTITLDSNTSMLPSGSLLSDIKVGDYIGVIGKVSEDAPAMSASVIRDWTAKKNTMMHDSMMKSDHMMASSTGGGQ